MVFGPKLVELFFTPVQIHKDEGASTKLMSKKFYNLNIGRIPISHEKVSVSHSYSRTDNEEFVITNFRTTRTRKHEYASNFFLAEIRYETFLRTPRHYDVRHTVECKEWNIQIEALTVQQDKSVEEVHAVQGVSNRKFAQLITQACAEVHAVISNALEARK